MNFFSKTYLTFMTMAVFSCSKLPAAPDATGDIKDRLSELRKQQAENPIVIRSQKVAEALTKAVDTFKYQEADGKITYMVLRIGSTSFESAAKLSKDLFEKHGFNLTASEQSALRRASMCMAVGLTSYMTEFTRPERPPEIFNIPVPKDLGNNPNAYKTPEWKAFFAAVAELDKCAQELIDQALQEIKAKKSK